MEKTIYKKQVSLGFVLQCHDCSTSIFAGSVFVTKLEYSDEKNKYIPTLFYCEKCAKKHETDNQ